MLFINRGETKKIRLGDIRHYSWITFRKGDVQDLPESVGLKNGLEPLKVVESSINGIKVETKLLEKPPQDFFLELMSVDGIGKKTAQDILQHYPTKKDLIDNLEHLGLRDDIEDRLRKKYGK